MSLGWSAVALFALAAGCASSAAATGDGEGEQGLGDLRRALGVFPAVGHVAHDADGVWLVHDATGLRLGQVLPPNGPCRELAGEQVLVFEGQPGAALAFSDYGVTLWQLDPARHCAVQQDVVFGPAPVAMEPLVDTGWRYSADAPASAAPQVKAHVDLAGRPGGALVTLAQSGFEVRLAAADPPLFEETFADDGACSFDAAVERGTRADGTTVLHVWRTVGMGHAYEPEDERCAGFDPVTAHEEELEVTGEIWLELSPRGAARVVASDGTTPVDRDDSASSIRLFDLPRGALRQEIVTSTEQTGREGPIRHRRWSWSLLPPAGPEVVLLGGEL